MTLVTSRRLRWIRMSRPDTALEFVSDIHKRRTGHTSWGCCPLLAAEPVRTVSLLGFCNAQRRHTLIAASLSLAMV